MKKLQLFLLIFTFFGFIVTNSLQVFAAEPSVCAAGGFCMEAGNSCDGGEIKDDVVCTPIPPDGPPGCQHGGYCMNFNVGCSNGGTTITDASCVDILFNQDGEACCYQPAPAGKACCNTVEPPPSGPPNCENGGYCMNFNVGCSNGGTTITDASCVDILFNKNGNACCYPPDAPPPPAPPASSCGSPDESGACIDNNNNTIPGAITCERNSTVCCNTEAGCDDVFPIENIVDGPSKEFFDALNPLKTDGDPALFEQLSTPGGIVSRVLQFLFPLAGLVLFIMLVWGGFEILAKSAQGTKALEAGKNRITAAIVGFMLLFATYWMAQIIEAVFGIAIV